MNTVGDGDAQHISEPRTISGQSEIWYRWSRSLITNISATFYFAASPIGGGINR